MLRTISAVTAAIAVAGGGTAAASGTVDIHGPRRPSVNVHPPKLGVHQPSVTVQPPSAPRLALTPADCATAHCNTTSHPAKLAGTVVSYSADTLTVRTDSGSTYTGTVTAGTMVACPPQSAIANGHVFNPAITAPQVGQATTSAKPTLGDRYACSDSQLTAGRRIAGGELGRSANGRLSWIAVALVPAR